MRLNKAEFLAMNNPVRRFIQIFTGFCPGFSGRTAVDEGLNL